MIFLCGNSMTNLAGEMEKAAAHTTTGVIKRYNIDAVCSPVLDAVLTLSRRLKLMTVAEGVETQEQAEWLRGQGVHFLQGYWISRPLSLAGLVAAHDEPANYFTTR